MTDEGMAVRKVEDLDKSLRELAAQGLVENHYNSRAPLPPSLALVRKRDKTVIKTRKIIWDAYNIIAWVAIFLFGGILLAASLSALVHFDAQRHRNGAQSVRAGGLYYRHFRYSGFRLGAFPQRQNCHQAA